MHPTTSSAFKLLPTMPDTVSVEQVTRLGNDIIRRGKARPEFKSEKVFHRKFLAFFGMTPFICTLLWAMLEPLAKMPTGAEPDHLLWSLLFMKVCGTEGINCALVGNPDEKTFRKWAWIFVEAIADLQHQVVSAQLLVCIDTLSASRNLTLSSAIFADRLEQPLSRSDARPSSVCHS